MSDCYGPDRASDLAFMRGCDPQNLCWSECVELATEALRETGGDPHDRALLAAYDRRWGGDDE